MAKKTIERSFPGKGADELYEAVEAVIRKLGTRFDIECEYDSARRRIVVPEKMGLKGHCSVEPGRVRVDLEHGLMGTALVGTVKGYIEEKLDKLFG